MSEEPATVAFEAGFHDSLAGHHAGLQMLCLTDVSNADLSDYWYGWHQGKRLLALTPYKRVRSTRR